MLWGGAGWRDGRPRARSLGVALQAQERFDEAFDAYRKAAWSDAWTGAAGFGAAEIASLLAIAVARLHAKRPVPSEVSLGFSAPERVHTTPSPPGVPR